ncbi:MAG: rod shape-determining protein MreD [Erythrobacter sp.]
MTERLNRVSNSSEYGRKINRESSPWRQYSVPYISVIAGSILPVFVLVGTMPIMPPLGFMILLAWRIMRPGLLPIWVGLPLGAVDDLFSGQPFGSAILLWSLAMLAIEQLEQRFPWSNFWQDWVTAAMVLAVYLLLAMFASGAVPGYFHLTVLVPQIALSILLYPIIAIVVSWLDRFRLIRTREVF